MNRHIITPLFHMIDKFLIEQRENVLYTLRTKYKNEEYDKSKEKSKEK